MPVLDTNFLILLAHATPGTQRVLDRARVDGDLLVPAQAVMEFLAGVEDPVAGLQSLANAFVVAHTTDATVLEGAALRAKARRNGVAKPHWGDIHIGAVAALAGTYVVTTNKRDFDRLGVRAWDFANEPEPPAVRGHQ